MSYFLLQMSFDQNQICDLCHFAVQKLSAFYPVNQRNHTVLSASVNQSEWHCYAVALQLCRGRGSEKVYSRCLTHCCPFSCSKEQLLTISCPWHFTHIHTQSQQEATTEAASLLSLIFTLSLIKRSLQLSKLLKSELFTFGPLSFVVLDLKHKGNVPFHIAFYCVCVYPYWLVFCM